MCCTAARRGGAQDSSRRRAAAPAADEKCDAYLEDALRESECSIPPNPGTGAEGDEFRNEFGGGCDTTPASWGEQTFQCRYVDRAARLMDDPTFPEGIELQAAAAATLVRDDGTPYFKVSFRQKKVPGCGVGGLLDPDPDSGLCEGDPADCEKVLGTFEAHKLFGADRKVKGCNARTACIRDHKDHCRRESQFSIWVNDTAPSGKKLFFTRWAVYDHSVPKGGACFGGSDATKCKSCGVEVPANPGSTPVEASRLKLANPDLSLYPDGLVDLYRVPFSTAVDKSVEIKSADCTYDTDRGDETNANGCLASDKAKSNASRPLQFCSPYSEHCWFDYYSQQENSKLDLPISAEATYADGGFIDSLVKHTVVVWGYTEGEKEPSIVGCAQIRPVAREGSCFLATHVVTSYFRTYYCSYGGSGLVLIPFTIWLSYMFLVLGTTADNFFCPALESLSDMIGLTPRVAGVTLLALGNGAPDVFSIYASTKAGEYGIAVGEVTGAANFVCTGVIGICCIIHVNNGHDGLKARGMFLRDVFMLIVSTSYLLYILVDAHVTKMECTIFVSLYVVYVAMVIYGAKVPPLLDEDRPRWDKKQLEEKREAKIKKFTKANGRGPTDAERQDLLAELGTPLLESENGDGPEEMEMEDSGHGHGHGAQEPVVVPADADLFQKVLFSLGWYNKSVDDKFFCVIQLPVTLIRRLTIPVVLSDPGEPTWNSGFNRMLMLLNPPFTAAFLVRFYEDFTATYYYPFGGLWPGQAALVGFIAGLPLCYPVWLMTSGPLPSKALVDIYVVFSFISALFWINVVADELVALLATLGDILKINHAILGLTVLGCGNSMADLAADMSVTRAGHPNMAVTAAYAGPFFNMCIGCDYPLLIHFCSGMSWAVVFTIFACCLTQLDGWVANHFLCSSRYLACRWLQNWTVILDESARRGCRSGARREGFRIRTDSHNAIPSVDVAHRCLLHYDDLRGCQRLAPPTSVWMARCVCCCNRLLNGLS